MKEYFNGFSTQDLVDMKRNDDERKEKIEMKKEIERLKKENEQLRTALNSKESIIKEVREYIVSHREPIDEKNQKILYWVTDDFNEEDILEILDKVDKDV